MRRSLIWIALLVTLVAAGTASAGYPGKNGRLLFLRAAADVTNMDSNPMEIWRADPDGSRQGRLTIANFELGGVGIDSARWSPDGSLIAYATDCGNRYDTHCGVLRTMRADGHDKRTVDVQQVIWLCIVRVADGNVGCLTRGGEAAWSPDGRQLVYVA